MIKYFVLTLFVCLLICNEINANTNLEHKEIRKRNGRISSRNHSNHKEGIQNIINCVKKCENDFLKLRKEKEIENPVSEEEQAKLKKEAKVDCHYKCIDDIKHSKTKKLLKNSLDKKHKKNKKHNHTL